MLITRAINDFLLELAEESADEIFTASECYREFICQLVEGDDSPLCCHILRMAMGEYSYQIPIPRELREHVMMRVFDGLF